MSLICDNGRERVKNAVMLLAHFLAAPAFDQCYVVGVFFLNFPVCWLRDIASYLSGKTSFSRENIPHATSTYFALNSKVLLAGEYCEIACKVVSCLADCLVEVSR
jgi:hypothetical protein